MRTRGPLLTLIVILAGLVGATSTAIAQEAEPVPFIDAEGNQLGTVTIRGFEDPFTEFDPARPPAEGQRYTVEGIPVDEVRRPVNGVRDEHSVRRTAIGRAGLLAVEENVRERLAMRDLMDHLRSAGVETGGPATLTKGDRQAFANGLDRLLTRFVDPD